LTPETKIAHNNGMSFLELRYFSNALQKHTAANVILPEVGEPPYPTLYLLHGLSDDHTAWARNTSIERYVSGLPLIVVMPDGGRGFYLDAAEGFQFGAAIGTELPERIERTFPAKRTRDGRALAGLSMGGYGALRLALTHPDRFCAAASLSGAVGWGHFPIDWADKPYSPEFQRVLGKDFVGTTADIWHTATQLSPEERPALRFDCGEDDFLFAHNQALHTFFAEKGVTHEYAEHPGAHNWAYWDEHIRESITFVMNAMTAKTSPGISAAG
jgi:S-formylglutathione hydrolase FrmB